MAAPLLLLTQLASFVPGLLKFVGAGERAADIAEKAVGVAKMLTGADTGDDALSKLKANPELQAKFQLAINEQMLAWDQMYLQDVQDARARDARMQEAGYRNWRGHSMYVLAVLVIAYLVYAVLTSDLLNEYAKGIITLVLGRFLGYLDQIYSFEFGTTRSSQKKDETIKQLTNGKH